MILYKEFTFDSAHSLPKVPDDHKCKQLHGHTYHIKVSIEGPLNKELGWIIDYSELKAAWKKVEILLDHKHLNQISGLENPTAEIIVIWIWDKLKPILPELVQLELKETPTSGVIYSGEYSNL